MRFSTSALRAILFGYPDSAKFAAAASRVAGAAGFRARRCEGGLRLKRPGLVVAGVVVLLLVLVGQLAFSVSRESLSWDEGDHIYAGYMSWKHDFGLNPEHPPLVKMVATLPLLFMGLTEPPLQNRYFKTEAYFDGRDLIFNNN